MCRPTARIAGYALLLLALPILLPTPSAASLIGYWSFDGCTATDGSGNGLNLTAVGSPTCAAGRFGNGWLLNGTNQYLERGFTPAFTPVARAWTVAAWERTSTTRPLSMVVNWYKCGANPSCGLGDAAYYYLALENGHPIWEIRDDATLDIPAVDSTLNVADGAWHFLVGTMNPTTDSTKLYVDGALRVAVHGSIGTLTSGSVSIPFEVGRHFRSGWGEPDFYFPGALDEVRIYDEELPAAQIAALFTNNATTAALPQELRGLTIERSSPNPNHGDRLLVAFTLPVSQSASLALYDIGGRLIARRAVGTLGAGRHEVEFGAGRPLAPGLYMIQLTQGGHSESRRVTMLR